VGVSGSFVLMFKRLVRALRERDRRCRLLVLVLEEDRRYSSCGAGVLPRLPTIMRVDLRPRADLRLVPFSFSSSTLSNFDFSAFWFCTESRSRIFDGDSSGVVGLDPRRERGAVCRTGDLAPFLRMALLETTISGMLEFLPTCRLLGTGLAIVKNYICFRKREKQASFTT
jgi:hypothetical protein